MPQPEWVAEEPVDASRAADLIAAQFPELRGAAVEPFSPTPAFPTTAASRTCSRRASGSATRQSHRSWSTASCTQELRARVLAVSLAAALADYADTDGRPALLAESLAGLRRAST